MKSFKTVAIVAGCTMLMAVSAFAQFRDAGSKIRGEQFVPGDLNDTRMRQQHASDHSQMIYYYSQMAQPPKAKIQEHATQLKQNTEAARKSLAKVKAVDPKDEELQKRVKAIEALMTKCEAECDMMSKHLADEKGDKEKIAACCIHSHNYMEQAKAETDKLMKDLGIKKVEAPPTPAAKK